MEAVKLLQSLVVACAAAMPGVALAQGFPTKPITIIVPFPPGGVTDPVARQVGARVAENVKQSVIVENKPGASGIIASEYVKRQPADGYTVLFGFTGSHAVNPTLYSKLPYDPQKDFQPVTLIINTPHILVVPADSPAKSVADLVALAKTKPGGLTFASQGIGAGGHLLGEMFKAQTKSNLSHVPYKGSAPALTDMLAGRVDRALAIANKTRSKLLPDVPTMAEAGFPGVEMDQWFGMMVPAGTPQPVVQRLNQEFIKAVRSPDIEKSLTERGLDVVTTTPDQFAAVIKADTATLGKVVRESGAKAD